MEEKVVTATHKINAVEVQLGPARERVSTVYIVDKLRYECVVSIGLLRQMGAIIDCRTDTIKWEVRAQRSDKKEQSDGPTMCAIEVTAMAAGELDGQAVNEPLPMSDMEQEAGRVGRRAGGHGPTGQAVDRTDTCWLGHWRRSVWSIAGLGDGVQSRIL